MIQTIAKRIVVMCLLLISSAAFAQSSMPSTEEINELVSKADEKVTAMEGAIKTAKPLMDRIDPAATKKDLEAASVAHLTIKAIKSKQADAYLLVSLLSILDDLDSDAATTSVELLANQSASLANGERPDPRIMGVLSLLSNARIGCRDISELVLHVTLRYVENEEMLLSKLLSTKGKK